MDENELTDRERERYDIVRSCIDGDITNKDASFRLGIQIRQIQKLKRAVEKNGAKGVIHGRKGRPSGNRTAGKIVNKALRFLKQKNHRDFGPTFAQEKLTERGVAMSTEALRLLMIKERLWKPRPRRGPQVVRMWRERMARFGEMVQFDGSYHDWFEDGTKTCLLAAIDDATGEVIHAVFEDNEGVHAVFRFWWTYMERYGRPVVIYLDKFSTYKINHKNAVDNKELMTQFERVMAELDIRVICANSPEAKGRVERLFGTLQDRLIKEMRLACVKKRSAANVFLHEVYLPDHNRRFGVPAKEEGDAHRPLTDLMEAKLSSIFSLHFVRKVNNDYTIQFKTRWFQLEAQQNTTVYKRDEVIVEEHLDDTVHIRLKDVYLEYRELPERPKPVSVPVPALTKQKPSWKPPKDHPWRKFLF